MKKIFLFLILCLFASSVFAQHGTFTVTSNNNQKFWLFIDDVLQNEYSTNIIRIQGLQFNYYKIRIEMDNNPYYNCLGETVLISNMTNNNNYVVAKEKGNFYSFKKTQMPLNPFFIQNLILPNYNYFSDYDQFLFPGFNPNVNYGQNQFKGNVYKKYQYNSGYNQGYGNQGYNQGYGNQGYNQGHGNQGYNQVHGNSNTGSGMGIGCMPAADFNRAISVIQKESFDESKLNVAKQMTSSNRLCVSQIIQICSIFTFEKTKLDYAKYAYRFCSDQNNYYQINTVFEYSSSKDELRKYIGN